jgi:nicotinamidase-related amidase
MQNSGSQTPQNKATYLPKDETSLGFPLDRTALLVIDPVNDFLSEGGAGYELTKNTLKLNNTVSNIKKAIEGARAKGIRVLYGPMAYTEADYADEQLQRRSGINRLMFENKMFLADSWGADFHPDLKPQEGDIILLPHKSCDVFRTDLPEYLQQMGITHLVIAGMAANLCCESTARHAMEDGYDVTMLKDAMGAASLPEYEAAVHLNLPLIANSLINTDQFLSAIGTTTGAAMEVQKDDTVYGSDLGEIGKVEEVATGTDGKEGYLLLSKGLIFKTDMYIPLDAVVKRSGTDVFINIPKLVVGKMPWSEAPTKAMRNQKQGPADGDVNQLYQSRNPSQNDRSTDL